MGLLECLVGKDLVANTYTKKDRPEKMRLEYLGKSEDRRRIFQEHSPQPKFSGRPGKISGRSPKYECARRSNNLIIPRLCCVALLHDWRCV